MVRKSTEYTPTRVEEILLEVLLDPANRLKTVTEVCGLVPCDRKTYYKAFKKLEFMDLYKDLALEMVKHHVAPVLNAFVKEATRGSFPHGKVLLEMSDMYCEKNKTELTGKGGGPIQTATIDLSNMPLKEIERELIKLEQLNLGTKKAKTNTRKTETNTAK